MHSKPDCWERKMSRHILSVFSVQFRIFISESVRTHVTGPCVHGPSHPHSVDVKGQLSCFIASSARGLESDLLNRQTVLTAMMTVRD
jgi:hypothetical protein